MIIDSQKRTTDQFWIIFKPVHHIFTVILVLYTVVLNAWNPPKLSNFTNFSIQVSADSHIFRFRLLHVGHIQNLSYCCRLKYDRSISRFFFNLMFGGFFAIWPKNCALFSTAISREQDHVTFILFSSKLAYYCILCTYIHSWIQAQSQIHPIIKQFF